MAKYKFDWKAALIPGYGHYRAYKNFIHNVQTDGFQLKDLNGGFWIQQEEPNIIEDYGQSILGYVSNNAREEFLEDRAHTEMREDTAYQRGVEDMRKAGLNPYTIGANPSPSSSSSVGENSIMTQLQIVGSLLDIQNLSVRNKSLINNIIGTALNGYLRSKGL